MALLDDMKLVLRVSADVMDGEVQMLIDAAVAELARVGVRASLLSTESPSALVKQGIALYCKAHFGYDNDEAERFAQSFERVEIDLLNSTANVATARKSLGDAAVGEIPAQTHTGLTLRPVPTVTYDGEELVLGEDFKVSYLDNIDVGTATVLIEGTGAYCGVVVAEFEVVEG